MFLLNTILFKNINFILYNIKNIIYTHYYLLHLHLLSKSNFNVYLKICISEKIV